MVPAIGLFITTGARIKLKRNIEKLPDCCDQCGLILKDVNYR